MGEAIARLRSQANKITMAKSLRGLHPITKRTMEMLAKARPDEYGALYGSSNENCINLRVSKGSVRRALLIMDALLKQLEKVGFQVENTGVTR
jgi:hypothetical protein